MSKFKLKLRELTWGILSIIFQLLLAGLSYLVSIYFKIDIYKSVTIVFGLTGTIFIMYLLLIFKKASEFERYLAVGGILFILSVTLLLSRKAFMGKGFGIGAVIIIPALLLGPVLIYKYKKKRSGTQH